MVRRTRWNNDWHHRVPDFKLVYCGPKKSTLKEETKHDHRKKIVEMSIATDRDGVAVSKVERQK